MKESMKLKGHGYFERRKKDGTKIDSWECDNLIVTVGKVFAVKLLSGQETDYFNTIAIGEGTDEPAVGQEALGSEVKREVADISYEATAKVVFEKTFDFGSGEEYDITEAGLFNNSSAGGVMLDRFKFTAKSVDLDTDLYCKITITQA